MKEPKKELLAADGLITFFDQLGKENSIHKRVVLEVFLEELLNGKALCLFSETGQEGGPIDNSAAIRREGESSKTSNT